MLLPAASILLCLALHLRLPNVYPADYTPRTYAPFLGLCLALYLLLCAAAWVWPAWRRRLLHLSWLLAAAFLLLGALDLATLKTGRLRLPFVPSPDKIIEVYPQNAALLWDSFYHSMIRLFTGIFAGVATGLLSGVLMGWIPFCNYWLSPLLKIIGPMPSAAWLPIAVVLFPSYWASIFLIAVGVWFPLTLMVGAAIRNTDRRLVETARVLGASEWHILFHVAIPAAVPAVFTGLFSGLSVAFTALVIVEMLGVKSGLGWYINWASSWGEYAKIYATVAFLAVIFSVIISLLFRVRDHILQWQKGTLRW
jgi:NitT/TauT family transport system permease protein